MSETPQADRATFTEIVLIYDLLEIALEIALEALATQGHTISLPDQSSFWSRWDKLDAHLWPDGEGGLYDWLRDRNNPPTDLPILDRRIHFEGLRREAAAAAEHDAAVAVTR